MKTYRWSALLTIFAVLFFFNQASVYGDDPPHTDPPEIHKDTTDTDTPPADSDTQRPTEGIPTAETAAKQTVHDLFAKNNVPLPKGKRKIDDFKTANINSAQEIYNALHSLLAKDDTDDPTKAEINKQLSSHPWLLEIRKIREQSAESLIEQLENSELKGPKKKLAEEELKRRLATPELQAFMRQGYMNPEVALKRFEKLVSDLSSDDPDRQAAAAYRLVERMRTLNKAEQKAFFDKLTAALDSDEKKPYGVDNAYREILTKGIDDALALKDTYWKRSDKPDLHKYEWPRNGEDIDNAFSQAFMKRYHQRMGDNSAIEQRLQTVMHTKEGHEDALAKLKEQYKESGANVYSHMLKLQERDAIMAQAIKNPKDLTPKQRQLLNTHLTTDYDGKKDTLNPAQIAQLEEEREDYQSRVAVWGEVIALEKKTDAGELQLPFEVPNRPWIANRNMGQDTEDGSQFAQALNDNERATVTVRPDDVPDLLAMLASTGDEDGIIPQGQHLTPTGEKVAPIIQFPSKTGDDAGPAPDSNTDVADSGDSDSDSDDQFTPTEEKPPLERGREEMAAYARGITQLEQEKAKLLGKLARIPDKRISQLRSKQQKAHGEMSARIAEIDKAIVEQQRLIALQKHEVVSEYEASKQKKYREEIKPLERQIARLDRKLETQSHRLTDADIRTINAEKKKLTGQIEQLTSEKPRDTETYLDFKIADEEHQKERDPKRIAKKRKQKAAAAERFHQTKKDNQAAIERARSMGTEPPIGALKKKEAKRRQALTDSTAAVENAKTRKTAREARIEDYVEQLREFQEAQDRKKRDENQARLDGFKRQIEAYQAKFTAPERERGYKKLYREMASLLGPKADPDLLPEGSATQTLRRWFKKQVVAPLKK